MRKFRFITFKKKKFKYKFRFLKLKSKSEALKLGYHWPRKFKFKKKKFKSSFLSFHKKVFNLGLRARFFRKSLWFSYKTRRLAHFKKFRRGAFPISKVIKFFRKKIIINTRRCFVHRPMYKRPKYAFFKKINLKVLKKLSRFGAIKARPKLRLFSFKRRINRGFKFFQNTKFSRFIRTSVLSKKFLNFIRYRGAGYVVNNSLIFKKTRNKGNFLEKPFLGPFEY